MEASQPSLPEHDPSHSVELEREIIQSYWERQAGLRADARLLITANPMNTQAKLDWIDADQRQQDLLDQANALGGGHDTAETIH